MPRVVSAPAAAAAALIGSLGGWLALVMCDGQVSAVESVPAVCGAGVSVLLVRCDHLAAGLCVTSIQCSMPSSIQADKLHGHNLHVVSFLSSNCCTSLCYFVLCVLTCYAAMPAVFSCACRTCLKIG
jgi:hypothetical protein